ncbi:peptidase P60, partial [Rhizobiales bacterium L72]|nr:peptidase P60 [Propylenella binzhouense]
MTPLDPRRNAFRPDLADIALKGRVAAARFGEATPMRVAAPVTALRDAPRPDAARLTEALRG